MFLAFVKSLHDRSSSGKGGSFYRPFESELHAECDKSTCCKSDLETMQLVLIDTLDYETKQN